LYSRSGAFIVCYSVRRIFALFYWIITVSCSGLGHGIFAVSVIKQFNASRLITGFKNWAIRLEMVEDRARMVGRQLSLTPLPLFFSASGNILA
jgi:hypothetical protein